MNAPPTIPLRSREHDWSQRQAEMDAEDDRILDDLFSGRRDAERLKASAQAVASIADLPPLPEPDPEIARQRADEAVAGLVRGFARRLPDKALVGLMMDQRAYVRTHRGKS